MTRWVPFLWLTVVVLVLLLGLARLSSAMVDDAGATAGRRSSPPPGEPTGSHVSTGDSSGSDPSCGDSSPSAVPQADEPPGDPAVGQPPGGDATAEPPRAGADAEPLNLSTGMLLANVALTQGLVGLAIAAGLWWFEIPGTAVGITADPWSFGLPAVLLGLGFGFALWLGNEVAAGLADAAGATYDEAVRSMLAPDTLGGWVVLLGLVLPTVAVVEELLFRAALIGVPAAALGVSPWLLAGLSSVAFALGHGAQGRVGIVVTGVLGLVLAAGYVLSGSLLVVVVAHYVVNAMEFAVHEAVGADRLLGA